MMTHTKIEGKFYALQNDEWLLAWSELKPAEVQVLYYLRTLDPFGDKEIELGVTQLSRLLGLAKSTVSKALKALSQLGWIDLEPIKVKIKLRSRSGSPKSTLFPVRNSVSHSEPQFPAGNSSLSEETGISSGEQPQLEIQSEQAFESSKTFQTLQTNQTEVGVEKISSQEVAPAELEPQIKQQNRKSSPKDVTTSGEISSFARTSNVLTSLSNSRQDITPGLNENNYQISQDVKNKLKELKIPLDGRVRKAIASHHISQIYGAIAHIERTWENINNPRSVFLFQIAKQPIEPLKTRLPVRTAADWGYTLKDLKRMYPNHWQDAAAHFGLEVKTHE